MDILSGYKQKGIIRALGVSCHSLEALNAAVNEPWVECVHARINPAGIAMDGSPDDVVPVLRKLKAAGKAVTGMKIIGEGAWRNNPAKREESIRYVLGLGCVDILNVGFETEDQIDDFAGVVSATPRRAA
jgi:predicted aldo/keto reductase-like oxidoreductase